MSVAFDFNASLNDVTPASPMSSPVGTKKKWFVDGRLLCVIFCIYMPDRVQWLLCLFSMIHSMMLFPYIQLCSLLKKENVRVFCWLLPFACLVCSQLKSTLMSVAFDFNDSLNDVTPVSLIVLPVDDVSMWKVIRWWTSFMYLFSFVLTTQIEFSECRVWFQWFTQWCCSCISDAVTWLHEEKGKEWFADGCLLCVFFLCFLPLRSISTSVVFTFSDSLNDVAPLAPIVLSVDALLNKRSVMLMDFFRMPSFVFTT